MITEKKNNLERIVQFRPGFHRVDEGYGVHGMEIWFIVKGEKGAVHFGASTGMMLQKTRDWWKERGTDGSLGLFPMGVDVGYHSPVPLHDFQKEDGPYWPKKMKQKDPTLKHPGANASAEEIQKYLDNTYFENVGDAPPKCQWLDGPCYCDGSALRAETFMNVFLEKGDDEIWKMLEEEYHDTFK